MFFIQHIEPTFQVAIAGPYMAKDSGGSTRTGLIPIHAWAGWLYRNQFTDLISAWSVYSERWAKNLAGAIPFSNKRCG